MKKKMTDILSTVDMNLQENLSNARLNMLTVVGEISNLEHLSLPRPKDSFLELMSWAEKIIGSYKRRGQSEYLIKYFKNINRFINNQIIIDGQFLQFCDEHEIKIEPIIKDSIVSWKADESEKFFAQGIFLITQNANKFVHCALLHKGNQNEDEISFFILTDNDNYDFYLHIRNTYEIWALRRDRSNLEIRVIDGDDIPYEKDMSWDDIFLPTELKTNIKLSIDGFLKSKKLYEDRKIPWKRGILLFGAPGNGKTSLIKTIISNYDFKPVTILPSANDDSIREAFAYAQTQNPALLYFEDLDSLLQNINPSMFLNLLDGISTKNGLLIIATANNLESLKNNIKDRPSRFDRKFEIPLPNEEMSLKYIKKWFGKTLPEKELVNLASCAVNYEFSYAYIKELYISSIYNALSNDRDDLTLSDVSRALSQLMDSKFKKGKSIGIDKYLESNKK